MSSKGPHAVRSAFPALAESLAAAFPSLHDKLVCLHHNVPLCVPLRARASHIPKPAAVQCQDCTMPPSHLAYLLIHAGMLHFLQVRESASTSHCLPRQEGRSCAAAGAEPSLQREAHRQSCLLCCCRCLTQSQACSSLSACAKLQAADPDPSRKLIIDLYVTAGSRPRLKSKAHHWPVCCCRHLTLS